MKRDWISVHLFYHHHLSALLTDCVRPLIDELRAYQSIECFFFTRYWQGGPHIRLRFLPSVHASRELLQGRLERHIEKFFTACPASEQLREEEYRQAATLFAEFEYGFADDTPLYPNNSLRYIPYVPEYSRYGGVTALPIVEEHFMASSEVALALLNRDLTPQQYAGQALAMMLTGLKQYTSQINALTRIFESYFHWASPIFGEQQTRYVEQFERQYQRQSQQLLRLVEKLLHFQPDDLTQEHSVLLAWIHSLQMLKRDLCHLAQQDHFAGVWCAEDSCTDQKIHFDGLLNVILSCLHIHNNRLGVSLFEEAYFAFLLHKSLATKEGGEHE